MTDVRTLSVQQEYFNLLAAGLMGVHYSSGMAEDGSTIRYAHTAEKLSDSKYAWMSGNNGFFISTDGGKTWTYGWDDEETVVKLAAEAVGLSADALLKGILKTSLVKILGTEHFFWEGDAITISDPSDKKRLMKIGQYVEGNYGIAVSTDGGTNWEAAVNFGGVSSSSSGSSTTIIQGESIVKSETAPVSPAVDSLWIDKSMDPMRLKLWNGSEWKVVGYEPENTEPTEPEEPDNEDATDPDDNAEGGSG